MNLKMTNGAFNMGQMKKYLARFLGLFMSGFGCIISSYSSIDIVNRNWNKRYVRSTYFTWCTNTNNHHSSYYCVLLHI